jgi:hypothetical protein
MRDSRTHTHTHVCVCVCISILVETHRRFMNRLSRIIGYHRSEESLLLFEAGRVNFELAVDIS